MYWRNHGKLVIAAVVIAAVAALICAVQRSYLRITGDPECVGRKGLSTTGPRNLVGSFT